MWTVQFGLDSEWTFMFYLNGVLIIVRGNRPMHYMRINDGWMFNTSASVLLHIKEWVLAFWSDTFHVGNVTKMSEFVICNLTADELIFQSITPQGKSPVYDGVFYAMSNNIEVLIKE
jgi:hypothetical protein